MIHYFSLYQATHWLSFEDIFVFFCRHDSSVDSTYLQYIIILEAGRWPICFQVIMFNVYFLILMRATLSVDTSSRIRTASRDGDRAVGVDRTVAVELCPSPSNQISQYQMFS